MRAPGAGGAARKATTPDPEPGWAGTGAAPSLRWHLRLDPPLPGAENMAWDHTLAADLPPGAAVLRLYSWEGPTLSLGRNEPARGVYDPDLLAREGVAVVRRPTGGRAVLHHRELTYAVCAPIRWLGGVRAAYALLNRALAAGLRSLGAPVELAGEGPVLPPDAGPCFQAPAPGEVTAAGRKLVGSAQVRVGSVLLQHGSILLEDDQEWVDQLRVSPQTDEEVTRPATLREVLGRRVGSEELREALLSGFSDVLPGDWRGPDGNDRFRELPSTPRPELLEQYASSEWTWRR